ncbi:MAG: DUF4293 domain-containing protein [Lentimicrobiaceae bacterium]|nr:DUF4293 domain-containing protein [Lentimicrobiaceae bacterium]
MIQRIQSLFLLGAAVCFGLACFVPIGTFWGAEMPYVYTSWVVKQDIVNGIGYQTYYIGLLQLVLAVMSFAAIFFYKNRPLQSKICTAAIVISFIMLVLMLWIYPGRIFPQVFQIQGIEPQYTVGAFISLAPVVLLYLANKFILRDEKKVRAADRLR